MVELLSLQKVVESKEGQFNGLKQGVDPATSM